MPLLAPHRGLFITATDTGVGKTALGVALAGRLTALGESICPRKPVESGCVIHAQQPDDAMQLQQAAGNREPLAQICPWPLAAPLSPERAGTLSGIHLTISDLTNACWRGVERADFLLVEGAGGFFSPLAPMIRNAELAVALELPVLLVVADRLGCLNHAMLTVEAIMTRGLHLAAIVLNRCGATSVPGMDNATDLGRWLERPIYCLPELVHDGRSVGLLLQPFLEPMLFDVFRSITINPDLPN